MGIGIHARSSKVRTIEYFRKNLRGRVGLMQTRNLSSGTQQLCNGDGSTGLFYLDHLWVRPVGPKALGDWFHDFRVAHHREMASMEAAIESVAAITSTIGTSLWL